MAKWKPRHPARQVTAVHKCAVGQRYRTLKLLRKHAVPPMFANTASNLIEAECALCKGYHLVSRDDLKRHNRVLTVVDPVIGEDFR